MKKIIDSIRCLFGIHAFDKKEWDHYYGWEGEYLHSCNFCKKCGIVILRRLKDKLDS